jgi:hypothetical protein
MPLPNSRRPSNTGIIIISSVEEMHMIYVSLNFGFVVKNCVYFMSWQSCVTLVAE